MEGGGGVGGRWRTFEGITWSLGGNGVKISHCQQSIRRGLSETDCLGGGGAGESLEYYRALGGNNNRLLTKTFFLIFHTLAVKMLNDKNRTIFNLKYRRGFLILVLGKRMKIYYFKPFDTKL